MVEAASLSIEKSEIWLKCGYKVFYWFLIVVLPISFLLKDLNRFEYEIIVFILTSVKISSICHQTSLENNINSASQLTPSKAH